MKHWIRHWLGLADIKGQLNGFDMTLTAIQNQQAAIAKQILGTNRAAGRIIAKLDPEFVRSDFDPQRKLESDILSDQIIRKLVAEAKASGQPTGSF